MKDRLGEAKLWNAPLKNWTQNIYTRLEKNPAADLPDFMGVYNKAWDEMVAAATRDRVGEK